MSDLRRWEGVFAALDQGRQNAQASFGQEIRQAREDQGLSLWDAADRMCISAQYLRDVEAGAISVSVDRLRMITAVLEARQS